GRLRAWRRQRRSCSRQRTAVNLGENQFSIEKQASQFVADIEQRWLGGQFAQRRDNGGVFGLAEAAVVLGQSALFAIDAALADQRGAHAVVGGIKPNGLGLKCRPFA